MSASKELDPLKIVLAVQCAAHDIPGAAVPTDELQDHSLSLFSIVKKHVRKANVSQNNRQTQWRTRVLYPIVASFPDDRNLSKDCDDIEYVLLVCTVVLLAFELTLQRNVCLTEGDEAFIDETFRECFEEPNMLASVTEAVELEYQRLGDAGADLNVLSALWLVGARLAAVELKVEPQKSLRSLKGVLLDDDASVSRRRLTNSMEEISISLHADSEFKSGLESPPRRGSKTTPHSDKVSIDEWPKDSRTILVNIEAPGIASCIDFSGRMDCYSNDTGLPAPEHEELFANHSSTEGSRSLPYFISPSPQILDPSTNYSPPSPPRSPPKPHDVLIQIQLKPNRTFHLDFVTSISLRHDTFTLKTCKGLSLLVEEGVTVSEPFGEHDTCAVRGNGPTGLLSATLAIPAGCSYTFVDVLDFGYLDEGPMTGRVETLDAVFYLGGWAYGVEEERRTGKIVVQNE